MNHSFKAALLLLAGFFNFQSAQSQVYTLARPKERQKNRNVQFANNSVIPFQLPLKHLLLTSPYGLRIHPILKTYRYHYGIDFHASSDTVYAIMEGKVTLLGANKSLGNYIVIDHSGFQSIYGHLSSFLIKQNYPVRPGTVIGITGQTGRATGEHLHFSIKYKNSFINPLLFLTLLLSPIPVNKVGNGQNL